MRKMLWPTLLLLVALPLVARAQDDAEKRKPPKPKPDCLDGVKYDDGKFESGAFLISSERLSPAGPVLGQSLS
jgi:hypothetical protein